MEFTSENNKENYRICVKKKTSGETCAIWYYCEFVPLPTDDGSIEKSMYSFHTILLFMKWNLPTLLKKNSDDLLFRIKSQMKRNVRSKGTEDQIHCGEKKYQQKVEMKWKSDETGKRRKSRERGVQSDVVLCYECAKEHDTCSLYCVIPCDCANARVGCHLVAVDSAWKWL